MIENLYYLFFPYFFNKLNFVKFRNIKNMNTAWNAEREDACLDIANKAEIFIWLYSETANFYKTVNTTLLTIIVVSSYIFGTSGILTFFTQSQNGTEYVTLIIQFLIILTGILGSIVKSLKFSEKIVDCQNRALLYSILFIDIKKELKKAVNKRIDFDVFYEKINSEQLSLKANMLYIPSCVSNKYNLRYSKTFIKYDDLFIEQLTKEISKLSDYVEK